MERMKSMFCSLSPPFPICALCHRDSPLSSTCPRQAGHFSSAFSLCMFPPFWTACETRHALSLILLLASSLKQEITSTLNLSCIAYRNWQLCNILPSSTFPLQYDFCSFKLNIFRYFQRKGKSFVIQQERAPRGLLSFPNIHTSNLHL